MNLMFQVNRNIKMFFPKYIILIALFIMVNSYSLTNPSGTKSTISLRKESSSDKIMSDRLRDPDYYMVDSYTPLKFMVETQFLNDEEIMKYLYV